jgi:hypothetical protein
MTVCKSQLPPVTANYFENFHGGHWPKDPAAAFAKNPPPKRGGKENHSALSLLFSESYSQVYRR